MNVVVTPIDLDPVGQALAHAQVSVQTRTLPTDGRNMVIGTKTGDINGATLTVIVIIDKHGILTTPTAMIGRNGVLIVAIDQIATNRSLTHAIRAGRAARQCNVTKIPVDRKNLRSMHRIMNYSKAITNALIHPMLLSSPRINLRNCKILISKRNGMLHVFPMGMY